jgi:hypothetical protein
MKKEALETSPSVPQRERKRGRHPPTFPREKGGVGDIPRRSPAGKEALETSPNVPQKERKRWRHPPAFPGKKEGLNIYLKFPPAKRALLSFNLGFTGDEKEGFKDFIKQKKSVELDKNFFFLMFIPLKYQVS